MEDNSHALHIPDEILLKILMEVKRHVQSEMLGITLWKTMKKFRMVSRKIKAIAEPIMLGEAEFDGFGYAAIRNRQLYEAAVARQGHSLNFIAGLQPLTQEDRFPRVWDILKHTEVLRVGVALLRSESLVFASLRFQRLKKLLIYETYRKLTNSGLYALSLGAFLDLHRDAGIKLELRLDRLHLIKAMQEVAFPHVLVTTLTYSWHQWMPQGSGDEDQPVSVLTRFLLKHPEVENLDIQTWPRTGCAPVFFDPREGKSGMRMPAFVDFHVRHYDWGRHTTQEMKSFWNWSHLQRLNVLGTPTMVFLEKLKRIGFHHLQHVEEFRTDCHGIESEAETRKCEISLTQLLAHTRGLRVLSVGRLIAPNIITSLVELGLAKQMVHLTLADGVARVANAEIESYMAANGFSNLSSADLRTLSSEFPNLMYLAFIVSGSITDLERDDLIPALRSLRNLRILALCAYGTTLTSDTEFYTEHLINEERSELHQVIRNAIESEKEGSPCRELRQQIADDRLIFGYDRVSHC